MTEVFGATFAAAVIALLLCLGPAMTAGWLIQRQKRGLRALRRSPLSRDMLRAPGQSLSEELEDKRIEVVFELVTLTFLPSFPLAYLLLHGLFSGRLPGLWLVALITMGALAYAAWRVVLLRRSAAQMERLRIGLDGERAVGQELEPVLRQGAYVFHDFPAEHFNIDHIVIAPQGVFAIETKGYTKLIDDEGGVDARAVFDGQTLTLAGNSGRWALEQAARQAVWLQKWLASAAGENVRVVPVVALPGWFVDRKGRGEVSVLSGRELGDNLLKLRGAQPLDPAAMQRIVHQVEQRCRTVKPSYRPEEPEEAATAGGR